MLKERSSSEERVRRGERRTAGTATGAPRQRRPLRNDTPLITGKIEIDAAIRSQASTSGFVFVIAGQRGQAGAPGRTRRLPLSGVPDRFSLGDADSMLPAETIVNAVCRGAGTRLSATGDAAPQKGDIESAVQTIKVGEQNALLSSRSSAASSTSWRQCAAGAGKSMPQCLWHPAKRCYRFRSAPLHDQCHDVRAVRWRKCSSQLSPGVRPGKPDERVRATASVDSAQMCRSCTSFTCGQTARKRATAPASIWRGTASRTAAANPPAVTTNPRR